jgi:RNA-directed DNA polymerase
MTAVAIPAGAFSNGAVNWHTINWSQAYRTVRRLQVRIVKATQAGRWNKVRALQHLLTHSFSGRVLAVRRVTENQGKRTPGVDGQTWDTPAKKTQAINELRQRGYTALPLRRVYIPKKNGRLRPLSIPAMKDRAMQALYLLALEPIAETTGDVNSYGFRKERSTADAIAQCFTVLGKQHSPQWILEGDIQSCYDDISHPWLLSNIPMDKRMLRQWLKTGFVEHGRLYPTEAGTPQGGIASPVSANLTLDGLEKLLRARYPTNTRRSRQAQVNYVRFADDFICTGKTKEVLEAEVKPLIEQFLQARGLRLSPEKTRITRIEDGFDFLGQHIRKYDGKLLITPSAGNMQKFLDKVRTMLRTHQHSSPGVLVLLLNPLIRGWANYHRHVVSKRSFSQVDCAIFQALWRWAKRRHPHKGRRWIARKYFLISAARRWTFFGQVIGKNRKSRTAYLSKASDTPIRRHVKIQGVANPYDPTWEMYFEQRLGVKMAYSLRGRRTLMSLWKAQQGRCLVCQQQITPLSGWHQHHLVRRVDGGSNGLTNLVLLHPECHRQVHSHGRTVVKPRTAKSV